MIETVLIQRKASCRNSQGDQETRLLSEWRDVHSFVLLGEPGAGKSTALKQIHDADPDGTVLISARNFCVLGPPIEYEDKILLIDALDEYRSGSGDRVASLDQVRLQLAKLSRPRFRLTCRQADWSSSDLSHLRIVADDVRELYLKDLDDDDVRTILVARNLNADYFFQHAQDRRLQSLIYNPLLLDLIINAIQGDKWPATREDTYRLACENAATEYNFEYRANRRSVKPIAPAQLLAICGKLCALILLSNRNGFTLSPQSTSEFISIDQLSSSFGLEEWQIDEAISSRLFIAENNVRIPRHRTIAEYLAALYLAREPNNLVSADRLLALMRGFDGRIIDPMRGLYAWIATIDVKNRSKLIYQDPFALILYGDPYLFSAHDKRRIFDALYVEAERYPGFRRGNLSTKPFGLLGTSDMAPYFEKVLNSERKDQVHEVILDCVGDAIANGASMPSLLPSLERIFRDPRHSPMVRESIFLAYCHCCERKAQLLDIINVLQTGVIQDIDDRLLGYALEELYPESITPETVFKFFHKTARGAVIGRYHMFWAYSLCRNTPRNLLPRLADALSDFCILNQDLLSTHLLDSMIETLLPRLVEIFDATRMEKIHHWLQSLLHVRGGMNSSIQNRQFVSEWFSQRPEMQKSFIEYAFSNVDTSENPRAKLFWEESLLCGASHPIDWHPWLIHLALNTANENVAKYCIESVAAAAMKQIIPIEYVEQKIPALTARWIDSEQWIRASWLCLLDSWETTYYRDLASRKKEIADLQRQRRKEVLRYDTELLKGEKGNVPISLLSNIARAAQGLFSDVAGETAEEQVMNLLAADGRIAHQAIRSCISIFSKPLQKNWRQIINQPSGTVWVVTFLYLFAARQIEDSSISKWDDDLAKAMLAYYLVSGESDKDLWIFSLVKIKPDEINEVLTAYLLSRTKSQSYWDRAHIFFNSPIEEQGLMAALATEVTVSLFLASPEYQIQTLCNYLIPAYTRLMDKFSIERLVEDGLAAPVCKGSAKLTSLYLLLGVLSGKKEHISQILFLLESDSSIIDPFSEILAKQIFTPVLGTLRISDLEKLIEIIGANSAPQSIFAVSESSSAQATQRIINVLSERIEPEASMALDRLLKRPSLNAWEYSINSARVSQLDLRRSNDFRFADVGGVLNVLMGSAPANSLDFATILIDELVKIANEIRFTDTNELNLFWRTGGQKERPKIENDCRDILLGRLRVAMTRYGIQVEKESQAARDKRADLQASALLKDHRVIVPIEVKKDDHPQVWTAWEDQLSQLYMVNPYADGVGIYLVLWFGHRKIVSPDGTRISSAEEMAREFGKRIPHAYYGKLFGLVIDLSR